jgi:RHS repeat-associated protein
MTPQVQYSYADGSSNTIRITGITYPNGRNVVDDYGATGSMNDAASRIFGMKDSGASSNLVEYSYLGLSGFVRTVYPESSAQYTLIGTAGGTNPDSGDIYLGLDRFGRVIDANWANVAGTAPLARVKYGYNRVSSRTWRDNLSPGMTGYDELYGYDQLQRLQNLGRGTLNGTQTAITSPTFGQDWTLDETGNWNGFKQDNTGSGTWNLDQTRTANTVNEITSLVNETSKAWTTPGYDKAGNMTRIPVPGTLPDGVAWNTMSLSDWDNLKLADWEEMTLDNVEGVYDAWNRLVRLHVGDTTLAEYTYDARGYRIRKDSYTDGTLSEARHYYYTPGWQVVEERVGTSTSANRQFVWGLRYNDDLVLRDRDTDGNGTLDERRYCLQDGNWNTIALVGTSGTVTERFNYDAYGVPTFLTSTGTVQASSATGWETLYAGYRWDGDPSRMYYVRNRFLLPYVGTWNRRDPIGQKDSLNQAQVVDGRPLTYVDPAGLSKIRIITKIGDKIVKVRNVSEELAKKILRKKTTSPAGKADPQTFVQCGPKGKQNVAKRLAEDVSPVGDSVRHPKDIKGHPAHHHPVAKYGSEGGGPNTSGTPHIGTDYKGSASMAMVAASGLSDAIEETVDIVIELSPVGDIRTVVVEGPMLISNIDELISLLNTEGVRDVQLRIREREMGIDRFVGDKSAVAGQQQCDQQQPLRAGDWRKSGFGL